MDLCNVSTGKVMRAKRKWQNVEKARGSSHPISAESFFALVPSEKVSDYEKETRDAYEERCDPYCVWSTACRIEHSVWRSCGSQCCGGSSDFNGSATDEGDSANQQSESAGKWSGCRTDDASSHKSS